MQLGAVLQRVIRYISIDCNHNNGHKNHQAIDIWVSSEISHERKFIQCLGVYQAFAAEGWQGSMDIGQQPPCMFYTLKVYSQVLI